MYIATLVFHIFIACLTIAAIVYSVYALMMVKDSLYKKLAAAIAILAAIETASGFALAVLSPTVTVAYVASHLVWYLGLCLVAESALLLRMRAVWIG